MQENAIPEKGKDCDLHQIAKIADNPRIIYDMKANIDCIHKGEQLITNNIGVRDIRMYPIQKDENTITIAGIGDSVMYGWRVPQDKNYLSIIEQKRPNTKTLNFAVPGYNTAIEIETVKEKVLPYHPDIVVLGFVYNDFDLPNFIVPQENYWTLKKSFLLERLNIIAQKGIALFPYLQDSPRQESREISNEGFEDTPQKVPEHYRDMVGFENFKKYLRELKQLEQEHGFKTIVFLYSMIEVIDEYENQYEPEIISLLNELDIPYVSNREAFRHYMKEHDNTDKFRESSLIIAPDDPHPSIAGHDIISDLIINEL